MKIVKEEERLLKSKKEKIGIDIIVIRDKIIVVKEIEIMGKNIMKGGRIKIIEIGIGDNEWEEIVKESIEKSERELGKKDNLRKEKIIFVRKKNFLSEKSIGIESKEKIEKEKIGESSGRKEKESIEKRKIDENIEDKIIKIIIVEIERIVGIGSGWKIGIERIEGGIRVGEDKIKIVKRKIIKVIDVIRIELEEKKGRERIIRRGIIGKKIMKIRRDEIEIVVKKMKVKKMIKGKEIGLKKIKNGEGMIGGKRMGMVESKIM